MRCWRNTYFKSRNSALTPIKDLVQKRSGKVATLDKNWKLKEATPSAFVADGIKPTFKITTALGKEIEATAVHPFTYYSRMETVRRAKSK